MIHWPTDEGASRPPPPFTHKDTSNQKSSDSTSINNLHNRQYEPNFVAIDHKIKDDPSLFQRSIPKPMHEIEYQRNKV